MLPDGGAPQPCDLSQVRDRQRLEEWSTGVNIHSMATFTEELFLLQPTRTRKRLAAFLALPHQVCPVTV